MADSKGLKRICMSCGARFYDLNKHPIICPNCGEEFTGEIKVRSRRARNIASDVEDDQVDTPVVLDSLEDGDEIEREEGIVSLEDIDEDGDDIAEDEIDIEEGLDIDEDLADLDDAEIEEDAEDDDEKEDK